MKTSTCSDFSDPETDHQMPPSMQILSIADKQILTHKNQWHSLQPQLYLCLVPIKKNAPNRKISNTIGVGRMTISRSVPLEANCLLDPIMLLHTGQHTVGIYNSFNW